MQIDQVKQAPISQICGVVDLCLKGANQRWIQEELAEEVYYPRAILISLKTEARCCNQAELDED